ncbi:MAG: ATP-binding protein, partial [Brachymonas sp.]
MNLLGFVEKWAFVKPFSPWLREAVHEAALSQLPAFRRDAFDAIFSDVMHLPQMVSVTGPRRVGKTTLLKQCIQKLIADSPDSLAQAQRILYFSMDDPALELPGVSADVFFNELVAAASESAQAGAVYLFLDEIQRFPRWELYLKKYYDLKTPVKFVVSGSASSPIFKKSRESLLGRIKDFHMLPFSFREWYVVRGDEFILEKVWGATAFVRRLGSIISSDKNQPGNIAWNLSGINDFWFAKKRMSQPLEDFLFSGGFPEVWQLPTLEAKQTHLYQNQVERVIFEDLLIAAEFRKPEMLRRFYIGLLKDPGRETNIAQLSKALELHRTTIENYFPLLEATDLVWRLHKHTSTKATPKAGNFKTYLVDLAVRNAVMKLTPEQMASDATLMGHYAENVVANHLRRWPGLVELGYWRQA